MLSKETWRERVPLACPRVPLAACPPVLLLAMLVTSAARPTAASVVIVAKDNAFEAADVKIDSAGTVQVTGGGAAVPSPISTGQMTLLMFDVLPSDGRREHGCACRMGGGSAAVR